MEATTHTKGLRFARVLVWLVYAYFALASIILLFAFFLLLFDASTTASFTQWVYRSANRVLQPFRGIFPSVAGENGSVIDFAVLFAILMYGILALAVESVVRWLDRQIIRSKQAERRAAEEQAAASGPLGAPGVDVRTPPATGSGGYAVPGQAPYPGQGPYQPSDAPYPGGPSPYPAGSGAYPPPAQPQPPAF